jgi:hypothetical protein
MAVHCDESTTTDGGGWGGAWRPYRVPWSHCQVLAIYREVLSRDEEEGGEDRGEDGAATSEVSTLPTMTMPALSIRFKVCWFPRISEARPLAPRCGKKGGDDGPLMKCLEETPNDGTTEVILEGRQTTTICCGLLLGPVHVVGGGSKGADALGGTPPPPPAAFLPHNRREVSNRVACDKDGVPYPIGGPPRGRLDPRLLVKHGVRATRRYLDEDQVGRILDAVLRARGERLLRRKVTTTMTTRTMRTTDAHRTSGIDDCAGGAKKPPQAAAGGIAAAGPAVPHGKRLLFDDDFDDDDGGGGVWGKRTRLAAGGASADAHLPAARKSGDDGNVERMRDERKGPPPPPPGAKRGEKRRAGAMGGGHVEETMPGKEVLQVGVGGRTPPAVVVDFPPLALAINSSSAARCGIQRRRRCHYYVSCSLDHPLSKLTCKMSKNQPTTIQGHSRCIISQTSSSRT